MKAFIVIFIAVALGLLYRAMTAETEAPIPKKEGKAQTPFALPEKWKRIPKWKLFTWFGWGIFVVASTYLLYYFCTLLGLGLHIPLKEWLGKVQELPFWPTICVIIVAVGLGVFWSRREKTEKIGKSGTVEKVLKPSVLFSWTLVLLSLLVLGGFLSFGGMEIRKLSYVDAGAMLYVPWKGIVLFGLAWMSVVTMFFLMPWHPLMIVPAVFGFIATIIGGWCNRWYMPDPSDPALHWGLIAFIVLVSMVATENLRDSTSPTDLRFVIFLTSLSVFVPQLFMKLFG